MKKLISLISIAVLTATFAYPASAALDDDLIAWYPFEGDASDASGNGNHGVTRTGNVSYMPGQRGMAAWFDGTTSILLPQPRLLDGASNATISAWVYFSTSQGGQVLGAGDSRGGRDPITTRIFPLLADDCTFNQSLPGEPQVLAGWENGEALPGLSQGEWHLFTMVLREGGVFRGYVDDQLVKVSTNSAFSHIAYDADMPALVGGIEAENPGQFWNGGIDELRIYNRALSSREVAVLFEGGSDTDFNLSVMVSEVTICWDSRSNELFQVQVLSHVTGGIWTNLGLPVLADGPRTCITDTVDGPRRFYRAVLLP